MVLMCFRFFVEMHNLEDICIESVRYAFLVRECSSSYFLQ